MNKRILQGAIVDAIRAEVKAKGPLMEARATALAKAIVAVVEAHLAQPMQATLDTFPADGWALMSELRAHVLHHKADAVCASDAKWPVTRAQWRKVIEAELARGVKVQRMRDAVRLAGRIGFRLLGAAQLIKSIDTIESMASRRAAPKQRIQRRDW